MHCKSGFSCKAVCDLKTADDFLIFESIDLLKIDVFSKFICIVSVNVIWKCADMTTPLQINSWF